MVMDIGDKLLEFFNRMIDLLADIIENYIVKPIFSVVKLLFEGFSKGLGDLAESVFGGTSQAMEQSYNAMQASLQSWGLGPLAPVITITMIGGSVYVFAKIMWDYVLDIFNPVESAGNFLGKLIPSEVRDIRGSIRRRLRR